MLENRESLLPNLGLVEASSPVGEQLDKLKAELAVRYEAVNERIKGSANPYVHLRNGRFVWSRRLEAGEPAEHDPLFDAADLRALRYRRYCALFE